MNLLIFSDLHEDDQALDRLGVHSSKYDYVLGAGDLCDTNWFAEKMLETFDSKKYFFVAGNADTKVANEAYRKSGSFIHGRKVEIENELNIAGFGMSTPTPYGTYGELSEEEFEEGLTNLKIDQNTLLLLHCPPKGHFDLTPKGNIGSRAVLWAIEEFEPKMVFFGHIHERMGCAKIGQSTLVKLPPANRNMAASVRLDGQNIDVEFIGI
ncbi:metallophosphoesterase family protein [Candidatus Micrarchaeota archaeon]|nr:metallophosphoesterase family protein [Candidatus Micrarchaeota archaeon]